MILPIGVDVWGWRLQYMVGELHHVRNHLLTRLEQDTGVTALSAVSSAQQAPDFIP